jgi:hypothetical protein
MYCSRIGVDVKTAIGTAYTKVQRQSVIGG